MQAHLSWAIELNRQEKLVLALLASSLGIWMKDTGHQLLHLSSQNSVAGTEQTNVINA